MATDDTGSGAGGWIIAGVLLIGITLVALFVWPGYGRNAAAPAATEINVKIPATGSGEVGS